MNKQIIASIDRKFYSGYPNNWDNRFFREKILSFLQPDHCVLDIGAGSGYVKEMNFKNQAKEVTGIDLDPGIATNPFLHSYFIGSFYDLSVLGQKKFDLVICNSVMEHVEDPAAFVREISKVLKPGGFFLGKTPNRNHYMPLVARLTPLSFHKWFNKKGRPEEHTFETYYRMNTGNRIRQLFSETLFEKPEIEMHEGPPSYLRMNFIFYTIGWFYERITRISALKFLKLVMIISIRKKADTIR